jgi:hypothetical protein
MWHSVNLGNTPKQKSRLLYSVPSVKGIPTCASCIERRIVAFEVRVRVLKSVCWRRMHTMEYTTSQLTLVLVPDGAVKQGGAPLLGTKFM